MSYNKYLEITNVVEFEYSLKKWLKNIFSNIKIKIEGISTKTEVKDFDKKKFFKDRFTQYLDEEFENLISDYTGDTNKLISIIYDSTVKILNEIRFDESGDFFLNFEELYEILYQKLVRLKDSSEKYTLIDSKFSVLSDTFEYIKQNVVSEKISVNWINQSYWENYYYKIHDKKTKHNLRILLLLVKMIKNREERLKKMDIKQYKPKGG